MSRGGARLRSLDVFRGLAVAAMIFVNSPGDAPAYVLLEHMPWHGWTPTDLIFPAFLFIVGAAIPFARPEPAKAAKRAALLFALGLLGGIRPGADAALRIPGVLQRIALCYLPSALLQRVAGGRGFAALSAALLFGYWLLLMLTPMPGRGPGDLTPAGNLASYVDRLVLDGHMANAVYDAEGLLSTIPAAATTMLGALAGFWLLSRRPGREKAAGLAATGLAGAALGLLWARWLPLNKHLYTSSFAVLSCGLSSALLGLAYWLVDLRGHRRWTRPFEDFGSHALLAFCGSTVAEGVLDQLGLRARLPGLLFGGLSPEGASAAWSFCWVAFWFGAVKTVDRLRARRSRV